MPQVLQGVLKKAKGSPRRTKGIPRPAPQGGAAERYVRSRATADGMVRIEAQLLPDEAELVMKAIRAAQFGDTTGGDEPAPGLRPASLAMAAAQPRRAGCTMRMRRAPKTTKNNIKNNKNNRQQ